MIPADQSGQASASLPKAETRGLSWLVRASEVSETLGKREAPWSPQSKPSPSQAGLTHTQNIQAQNPGTRTATFGTLKTRWETWLGRTSKPPGMFPRLRPRPKVTSFAKKSCLCPSVTPTLGCWYPGKGVSRKSKLQPYSATAHSPGISALPNASSPQASAWPSPSLSNAFLTLTPLYMAAPSPTTCLLFQEVFPDTCAYPGEGRSPFLVAPLPPMYRLGTPQSFCDQ